ncbi:MAG: endonuclease/exonuclease/phosphatase family protein [Polyangiaceae bacterium]|nr:endonuclease/exonuclease/phosphatase family protein [Polyangiaceae bacterium]
MAHRTRTWLVCLSACAAWAFGCRESGTNNGTQTATGAGGTGAANAVPLVVANWNVHNFLNDQNDSAAPQEFVVPTADWNAHRQAVGAVMNGIDADILVLAEFENQATLDALNDQELGSVYTASYVSTGNDPRGINVAVMSKVPFDEVVSHASDSFTKVGTAGPLYQYARDCVEVHLTFNGRKLVLLGVHYKAKENDDPDKRLAEAQHTRAIADAITAADPTIGVLILGDFNDTPGSFPYLATAGSGAGLYVNAADDVAITARWTFNYNGTPELVDHQFGSPVLAPMVDPASVQILHGAEIDAASDHAPVIATYQIH